LMTSPYLGIVASRPTRQPMIVAGAPPTIAGRGRER
jgi:hypothetical protein